MTIALERRTELQIYDLQNAGGVQFSHECVAPYVLIGLIVRSGSLIDSITPIYSVLNDDGTISPQEMMGPRFGGNGGSETIHKKSGSVIVGLNFKQGNVVDQLQVVWQKFTSKRLNGKDEKTEYCGGQGGEYKDIHAPEGYVATGIYGRCGSLIDRISLIACKPVIT